MFLRGYPLPFAALGWRCQCSTNGSAVMVILFLFFFQVDGSRFDKREACRIQASEKRDSATRDVVACCMLEWALEKRNDDEMPTLVL